MAGTSREKIAVIGGGIIGQSVALELTRRGLQVCLIYPRDHGPDSATLAAGAMVGAFGDPSELTTESGRDALRHRLVSHDMFPRLLDQLRDGSGAPIQINPGIFMIANGRGKRDHTHINELQIALDEYDRVNEWVDPEDIPRLLPLSNCPVERALFIADDFSIDSNQLLAAMTATLEGGEYAEHIDDRATSIEPDGRGWRVHTAEHAAVSVPHVVIAAGARVPEVLGATILDQLRLPTLFFAKGFGCVVSGAPTFPHTIRTPDRKDACGVHAVPRANGQLYLGAATHYGHATAAARGITPGECFAIMGDTNREINRTIRDTTIERLHFGLRPVSADEQPLVGATDLPGLHLATGTFRLGYAMAPLIGHLVAAGIAGEPDENPWLPTSERLTAPRTTYDRNVANLLINEGLAHYNAGRGLADGRGLKLAVEAWRRYIDLVGNDADTRIVQLTESIESGEDFDAQIW